MSPSTGHMNIIVRGLWQSRDYKWPLGQLVMSLLPKTVTDFASSSFWDEFFSKRKSSFEWYGSYGDLCALLHKYSKPTSRVLVAGCGNSTLPEDLYNVGYRDVCGVDISGGLGAVLL